jgi:phosphomannomutase
MLDAIASSFGEKCYEVPIGFKYISAGIDRYDAVLGGESSGGLTVRGHIFGKDSVYAASLFVEMICAVGKTPSELWAELEEVYGSYVMQEGNFTFASEDKPRIENAIMVEKRLPSFGDAKIVRVNYEDGCKIYFEDGSFVICRFSGTEPLLRIFAEASDARSAQRLVDVTREFVNNIK